MSQPNGCGSPRPRLGATECRELPSNESIWPPSCTRSTHTCIQYSTNTCASERLNYTNYREMDIIGESIQTGGMVYVLVENHKFVC